MVKKFQGFCLPANIDAELAAYVDAFNDVNRTGCLAVVSMQHADCDGFTCPDCILRSSHKQMCAFANYARSKGFKITRPGYTDGVPLLKTGDVVKYEDEGKVRYLLMMSAECAYELRRTSSGIEIASTYWGISTSDYEKHLILANVLAIYRAKVGWPFWVPSMLERIVDQTAATGLYWSREEAKEMTVAQIEKALGHKIKVVGDQK